MRNGASITWLGRTAWRRRRWSSSLVDFQLDNHGRRHRFGLQPMPRPIWRRRMDPRRFQGANLDQIGGLARARFMPSWTTPTSPAWRTWVPLPGGLAQGSGAVRAWVGFDRGEVTDLPPTSRLPT